MKSKKLLKSAALLIFVIIAVVWGYFQNNSNSNIVLDIPEDKAGIYFVDVGQGDCTFVRLPDGKTMLIDCGEYQYHSEVENFLKSMSVTNINYLISTHPHADHIGSMAHIINEFDVSEFYMPDVTATTMAFEKMLLALDEKNISPNFARAGDVLFETDSAICRVLSPVLNEYENVNDASIVLKLDIGEMSFLFMGDAEHYAEQQITGNIDADVLKIGHHGSSGSTSEEFFKKVSPDVAVISCGKGNSYGHPHRETVSLLEKTNTTFYRTDINGTIAIECDGKKLKISTEK